MDGALPDARVASGGDGQWHTTRKAWRRGRGRAVASAGYVGAATRRAPLPATSRLQRMPSAPYRIPVTRNLVEYAAIVGWWGLVMWLLSSGSASPGLIAVAVVLGCWAKTVFFGTENFRQLFEAARTNLPHHRFLLLMGVNTSQMVLAFALDFHLLYLADPTSFAGISANAGQAELLFDFFYLSTLNFSFFGYSDILPETVPTKIVNLSEIVLAFVTVIVMLSDFISLKESLRGPDNRQREE
jgi:hypothetical protein